MAPKSKKKKAAKPFAKKRSVNVPKQRLDDDPHPGNVFHQDPKRRIGEYGGKGEPHRRAGMRGK